MVDYVKRTNGGYYILYLNQKLGHIVPIGDGYWAAVDNAGFRVWNPTTSAETAAQLLFVSQAV